MTTPQRPSWQHDPIFKFFASVKLAMLLLAVLTGACIFGTIYESGFDAKVARHYVYQARWFDVWLLLLTANLTVSAFSRWPWKKHHVAFLVTHLGIIILLAGAFIGRITGVEGTMTLHKGETPNNVLTIDEKILEITEPDGRRQAVNAEIFNRKPTAESPRGLARTADGWQIDAVDHAPILEVSLAPKAVEKEGLPALHFTLETKRMGQRFDAWLLADHPQHGRFDLGLATIQFKRGKAGPAAAPAQSQEAVDIEDGIFAFEKVANQVSRSIKGGNSGVKVRLRDVKPGEKGTITASWQSVEKTFAVADILGKTVKLDGTPFELAMENYWPDFRIKDGQPGTESEQPDNPAVLVRVIGHAVPVAEEPAPTPDTTAPGAPPALDAATAAQNHLTIFLGDDGALTYELHSRKNGASSGPLESSKELTTGWADWAFTSAEFLPQTMPGFAAKPVSERRMGNSRYAEGIRVRASRGAESREEWVPLGWQIGFDTAPAPITMIYGYRQHALPIGLQLTDFEVQRDEGTDRPAGFKSTLLVTPLDGEPVTGSCWMNNPFSHPADWLHTWSGFTYKISQASWNPQNPEESTVQILRDPGWSLKWIGSLLLTSGIFMLFYIPAFRRRSGAKKTTPESSPRQNEKPISV